MIIVIPSRESRKIEGDQPVELSCSPAGTDGANHSGGVIMRVVADLEKCQGHGLCRMSAPDVYGVTVDEGQVIVKFDGEIPPELEDAAALGVDSCPEIALSIED
jgi:ferredoxin